MRLLSDFNHWYLRLPTTPLIAAGCTDDGLAFQLIVLVTVKLLALLSSVRPSVRLTVVCI